ncbi:expressed unknown protein [Seminavis robusta]|uniref:Uncharacterized protein n=1 Tax=Seminavis robusta TaxID=568900 RepID=A0A9N8EP46_9STRA|nr:expressed unknown protein [Seminavis robusta]|eukprot:Sro1321_g262450.1 n/a (780) ;mRNA; r:3688-6115
MHQFPQHHHTDLHQTDFNSNNNYFNAPLEAEIMLMEELIVQTYNNLSKDYCDPMQCRLFSAIADHDSKSFFVETYAKEPADNSKAVPDAFEEDANNFSKENKNNKNKNVNVRIRYDLIGFCDKPATMQLHGAIFFHQDISKTTACVLESANPSALMSQEPNNMEDDISADPDTSDYRKRDGVVRARHNYRHHILMIHREQQQKRTTYQDQGFDRDTTIAESHPSSCSCVNDFPERRAPTEIEFVRALNEIITNASNKPGLVEQTSGYVTDVVEDSTLHTCSRDVGYLETVIFIDAGHTGNNIDALSQSEKALIEQSIMQTFNELAFWACDEPYHRRIESVELTEIIPSTGVLVVNIVASCRDCDDDELLLFTENPMNFQDVLYMPLVPFVAANNKEDQAICFCAANMEEVLRSPYITEFTEALNLVIDTLVQTGALENLRQIASLVEVEVFGGSPEKESSEMSLVLWGPKAEDMTDSDISLLEDIVAREYNHLSGVSCDVPYFRRISRAQFVRPGHSEVESNPQLQDNGLQFDITVEHIGCPSGLFDHVEPASSNPIWKSESFANKCFDLGGAKGVEHPSHSKRTHFASTLSQLSLRSKSSLCLRAVLGSNAVNVTNYLSLIGSAVADLTEKGQLSRAVIVSDVAETGSINCQELMPESSRRLVPSTTQSLYIRGLKCYSIRNPSDPNTNFAFGWKQLNGCVDTNNAWVNFEDAGALLKPSGDLNCPTAGRGQFKVECLQPANNGFKKAKIESDVPVWVHIKGGSWPYGTFVATTNQEP